MGQPRRDGERQSSDRIPRSAFLVAVGVVVVQRANRLPSNVCSQAAVSALVCSGLVCICIWPGSSVQGGMAARWSGLIDSHVDPTLRAGAGCRQPGFGSAIRQTIRGWRVMRQRRAVNGEQ